MTNVVDLNVNRAVDASGNYLAGAKAYFYQSGTSTPVTVYSDAAATTPHATPVVADGSGVFPAIYAAGSVALKVNVTTSSGAAVPGYPRDPVVIFSDTSTGASAISFAPITGNGALNVQAAIANIQPVVNDVSTVARTVTSKTTLALMRSTLAVGDNVNNTSTIQTTDADNCTASGFYRLQNTCANLPEAGFFDLLVISTNGTEVTQIAHRTTGAGTWRRVRAGGSWTAWVRMIDAGNISTYVGTTATIQNSTSGTAIDFTGIPANVSEITVMFDGVSLSGTDTILVQIGDSGGVETTGYVSGSQDSAAVATSTSGFAVRATTASDVLTGSMILTSMSTAGTRWVQQHGMYRNGASAVSGGGSKTLSAMLDRVRVTRTGTDTFDAGAITIRYR